jgi:hypothetical protein
MIVLVLMLKFCGITAKQDVTKIKIEFDEILKDIK